MKENLDYLLESRETKKTNIVDRVRKKIIIFIFFDGNEIFNAWILFSENENIFYLVSE